MRDLRRIWTHWHTSKRWDYAGWDLAEYLYYSGWTDHAIDPRGRRSVEFLNWMGFYGS